MLCKNVTEVLKAALHSRFEHGFLWIRNHPKIWNNLPSAVIILSLNRNRPPIANSGALDVIITKIPLKSPCRDFHCFSQECPQLATNDKVILKSARPRSALLVGYKGSPPLVTLHMMVFWEKILKFSKTSHMMVNDDFARKTLKINFKIP